MLVCYNTIVQYKITILQYLLRDSVVTMNSKVSGKTMILTHIDPKPLKIISHKLDILIKLRGATSTPNFMKIGPGVSAPQIVEISDFV